ncbi:tail fiber protein [Rhodopseudomonas sp. P2A-2r]|uniref:phage tail protein n=1 Tax=Rhodopseudomonas sp. P2A-2r TaxID=2991972 RepID=UPI002234593F|nr:tail fiber protein [Rhodopseudomonas sp. P2A-2r]UZE48933.1 tail fiber protein [Rhodopseudomonas sp. P2A-2r]
MRRAAAMRLLLRWRNVGAAAHACHQFGGIAADLAEHLDGLADRIDPTADAGDFGGIGLVDLLDMLPIMQNQALFSLLGTTYGGDGIRTFCLPDLRGRTMNHQGTGPGLPPFVIGEMAGSPQHTLLATNLPQHNHALNVSDQSATTDQPSGAVLAKAADSGLNPINVYGPTPNAIMNPAAIWISGSSQPFSAMQPYLIVNICIALFGVFPARG